MPAPESGQCLLGRAHTASAPRDGGGGCHGAPCAAAACTEGMTSQRADKRRISVQGTLIIPFVRYVLTVIIN